MLTSVMNRTKIEPDPRECCGSSKQDTIQNRERRRMPGPELNGTLTGDRTPKQLALLLDKGLLAYAAAASAAGVGLLALAPAADAKIVYRSAHIEIGPRHIFNLDLNHDGITDFRFSNFAARGTSSESEFLVDRLKMIAEGQNAFLGGVTATFRRPGRTQTEIPARVCNHGVIRSIVPPQQRYFLPYHNARGMGEHQPRLPGVQISYQG
jgi:hypothetical protein